MTSRIIVLDRRVAVFLQYSPDEPRADCLRVEESTDGWIGLSRVVDQARKQRPASNAADSPSPEISCRGISDAVLLAPVENPPSHFRDRHRPNPLVIGLEISDQFPEVALGNAQTPLPDAVKREDAPAC